MSALPENIVAFQLPKRPKVREKDAPPDQRKVCVLPFRAVFDQNLTHGALQVLAAVCAYCNRAGITWVSQTRLAKELGISQQAVAKQFKQLRDNGYLETIRKGFKGERTDTLRVIFDPSIKAEDAIAITSAIEDTRPPVIKEEQMKEEVDRQGQQRIAQMLAQAMNRRSQPKEKSMPKQTDTMAVRAVKEANAKAKAKRTKEPANHNPEVVNADAPQVVNEPVDKSVHSQPPGCAIHNPQVVENTKRTPKREGIDKVYLKTIGVLHNLSAEQRAEVAAAGVTDTEASQALQLLLDAYRAEGITPNPDRLAAEVISLADAGRIQ